MSESSIDIHAVSYTHLTLYSADGKVIYELGAESREIVEYEQIPQVTIDAFLAIEDSRYFKHNGFDLPRFISLSLIHICFKRGSCRLTVSLPAAPTISPINKTFIFFI